MSLAITTVVDSISKISVEGLTIKDANDFPAEVSGRDCPMVIPAPNFVTNFRPERVTVDAQEQDLRYTLNYRLLAFPVGAGRGIYEGVPEAVEWAGKFIDALLTNHNITGLVDLEVQNIPAFGIVTDPSDQSFHGCDIAIDVLEFK